MHHDRHLKPKSALKCIIINYMCTGNVENTKTTLLIYEKQSLHYKDKNKSPMSINAQLKLRLLPVMFSSLLSRSYLITTVDVFI